jgi:hypothetical protein
VIVTERTANGLPQRRRSRPTGRAAFATPPRTTQPNGPTAGPAAGPAAQAPRPAKKEPGLWLEAFMDGYKGTGASAGPAGQSGAEQSSAGQTSEETAGKGEQ